MERASRSQTKKKSISGIQVTKAATKKPTIDDLIAEINELKEGFQSVASQNVELKKENTKLKTELTEIYKDLDFLHTKINRMDQEHLMNDVEIVGVPAFQDEDLSEILLKLFDAVGHSSQDGAIMNVYRKKTPKNGLPGTIIASFNNISNKTKFVAATRKKKLDSSFLRPENVRPIYINEHLTKHNRYLYYLARDLRRKNVVKYAWTDHGSILVKTDDNTDSIAIDNVSAIERIRENSNETN
jgi:hypothetical protein